MMSFDRAMEICTLLLTQRVVERSKVPELEDDPDLLAEVKRRLEQCGLTLAERTGIPYLAAVIRRDSFLDDIPNELGLDRRGFALLLHAWIYLVLPFLYQGGPPPANIQATTLTMETLWHDLQDHWSETMLKRTLSHLVHAKFLKHVHGRAHTYAAGPMLWLAINHESLIEHVKRAAVHITAERFRAQQAQQEKEREE